MQEISIQDIPGIRIGQTENEKAGTGCTVFICPEGMGAGLDIRGGGPASRESSLLDAFTNAEMIHAVVLAGGSSFGLDAAGGVMRFLEEKDVGYDVAVTKVPLVVQSSLFDLALGDKNVRPDFAMGYEAARLAWESPNFREGCFGAGCGATVGKLKGMACCMKSGIGSFAIKLGDLMLGAVVVVNAFGDIHDPKSGRKLAGLLREDKQGLDDTLTQMCRSVHLNENKYVLNTTLAVVMTNAGFSKKQLCKIAGMAQNGLARCIRPVHTSGDGDSVYALSLGRVKADQDLAGSLAADVVSEAILRAVEAAEGAYGFPSARDLKRISEEEQLRAKS